MFIVLNQLFIQKSLDKSIRQSLIEDIDETHKALNTCRYRTRCTKQEMKTRHILHNAIKEQDTTQETRR